MTLPPGCERWSGRPAGRHQSWTWQPQAPKPLIPSTSLSWKSSAPLASRSSPGLSSEPEHLRVQWQGSASAGERLAEFAGRICYMSQHNPANRSTADYLENIKKQGHGSVLEHAVYVLLIEGISRSCSHELVRHRADRK